MSDDQQPKRFRPKKKKVKARLERLKKKKKPLIVKVKGFEYEV
jgi:hypothetical protein